MLQKSMFLFIIILLC